MIVESTSNLKHLDNWSTLVAKNGRSYISLEGYAINYHNLALTS